MQTIAVLVRWRVRVICPVMEGYVLLSRSDGRREASCEEQRQEEEEEEEEDIGCPSESEPSATDSMSEGELDDEASSSSSSSGSTESFEMSSLMTQLPLKRGLSKFFDGKSQSFASLAAVGGLEDLAKPMRKRLKTSRSCCGVGLQDSHRGGRFSRRRCHNNAASAAAAFKKVSRGRLSSLGKAPGRLTLPPMTARPVGLPRRALLFA